MAKVVPDDLFQVPTPEKRKPAAADADDEDACEPQPEPRSLTYPNLSPEAQELVVALQWLASLDG